MTPRACPNDRGAGLFTYALARETALPLFFQGTDFANTAIENAMALLGYGMSDKGVPQPLKDAQK